MSLECYLGHVHNGKECTEIATKKIKVASDHNWESSVENVCDICYKCIEDNPDYTILKVLCEY